MATVFKRGGKSNRNGNWYVQWFDHSGKRRVKCTRTPDRTAALRIAAKLETDAALRREGIVDAQQEAYGAEARKPLTAQIDAYEAKLEASGRSEKYATELVKVLRAIAGACAFKTVGDVSADPANAYAAKLKTDGRSARTIEKHLTIIKGFAKWLAATGKLSRDPLATISKPNPKADRRHERQMMLPEKWKALQASIAEGAARATVRDGDSDGLAIRRASKLDACGGCERLREHCGFRDRYQSKVLARVPAGLQSIDTPDYWKGGAYQPSPRGRSKTANGPRAYQG
jgi:hypothetical protein